MNENYYCAHLISIATLNKLLDRTELIGWTESVENYDKSFWLIFRFNFLLFILLCIAWCVRACSTTKCLCSINFFFIYCLSHSTELCKSSHWIIISSALLDIIFTLNLFSFSWKEKLFAETSSSKISDWNHIYVHCNWSVGWIFVIVTFQNTSKYKYLVFSIEFAWKMMIEGKPSIEFEYCWIFFLSFL